MSTQVLVQLPPVPEGVSLLSNGEIERLRESDTARFYLPNGEPGVQPNCITCSGDGHFSWYDYEDIDKIVTYQCDCIGQWKLFAAFTSANIQFNYQCLGWSDLSATDPEAVRFVARYLDNSKAHLRTGTGLLLYGEGGTGKSSLAALALKKLISLGHDGYFITFNDLISKYTQGWRDSDEKNWFHRRIKNAGTLVIDDLGKEYQGGKEFIRPVVDEVIRHRVAAAKPTIVTTNETPVRIGEIYGESVSWLLKEGVVAYKFQGENFRIVANTRTMKEQDKGLVRPVTVE